MMIRYLVICSLFFSAGFCQADDLSATSKEEIAHLFTFLENSGCQFNRNGSWYSAAEAAVHIRKKYTYLTDKKKLSNTESFIEKAASESSLSGKPYLVRCEGKSEIASELWFKQELIAYRAVKKPQR